MVWYQMYQFISAETFPEQPFTVILSHIHPNQSVTCEVYVVVDVSMIQTPFVPALKGCHTGGSASSCFSHGSTYIVE